MNDDKLFKDVIKSFIGGEQFFDSLLKPFSFPKYEILKNEKTNKIYLRVLLAGYKKEDIKITNTSGILSITYDKVENEDIESVVYLTERSIAKRAFKAQYRIAPNFKVEKASFEDGILTITFEEDKVSTTNEVNIE